MGVIKKRSAGTNTIENPKPDSVPRVEANMVIIEAKIHVIIIFTVLFHISVAVSWFYRNKLL